MRKRALFVVALLGLVILAAAPGFASAANISMSGGAAARAAAVSGPIISVNPLSHDFGVTNLENSSPTFMFAITNVGNTDLHIDLPATQASVAAPFSVVQMSCAGCPDPTTIPPAGTSFLHVNYDPSAGVNSTATVTIFSDDPNGPFVVNVSGQGNAPPVLDPIGNKTANAFVNLTFTTTASDPNDQIDDVLTFSVSPALPPGATYDTGSGVFSWTPTPGDAGVYILNFQVSDGNNSFDNETIFLTVSADNNPPVAVSGGPYSGGTGLPIQFNGSGSSDPDGDNLSYAWDFGDGGTGTGPTPTHAYTFAGTYIVSLTVMDDGAPSLSDSDITTAQVVSTISAQLTTKLYGGSVRISGGGRQVMGLEPLNTPATSIDGSSLRLSTTYPGAGTVTEVAADPRTAQLGDIDNDGILEMTVSFTRAQLQSLLGNVPNGTTVQLVLSGQTTGGVPVQGTAMVRIKTGGGNNVSAFASPNPFNPETAVTYTLKNAGRVTVRIFSLEGRLVKTLVDGTSAAGSHEVRWNGTDNNGRPVPSGMYFVKTESGADRSVVKLSLLK